VSLDRIREVKRREAFAVKVLSPAELELFEGFSSEQRQVEFLAGRWAVKEAIYKAIPDFCKGMSYATFTILNDAGGKPYVAFPTFEGNLQVSITHERKYAVAFVVAEMAL